MGHAYTVACRLMTTTLCPSRDPQMSELLPSVTTRPLTERERTISNEVHGPLVVAGGQGTPCELIDHCVQHRATLRELLTVHGGLLFRGFGVRSTESFGQVLKAMDITPSPFPYAGNTLRTVTGPNVFDVTAAPSWSCIFPHNEMFYWFRQPRFISFFCERSACEAGETTVVDGRQVWRDLAPALQESLMESRFFVVSRFASEDRGRRNPLSLGTQLANTWQAVGDTADRGKFEAQVADHGAEVRWGWDGTAHVRVHNALVLAHPETSEPCFRGLGVDPLTSTVVANEHMLERLPLVSRMTCHAANAAISAVARVQRQTGLSSGRLDRAQVRQMYEAVWRNTAFFRWEPGDVLVLDNVSTGHGRMNVDGDRALHVALGGEVWMRDLGRPTV